MQKVTSADGTTIAYDRSGTGPAVILVGGGFAERTNPIFTELAEALSSRFTVFNYDRRGRGDSGDTEPYAVQREIEDIDALIAEAGGSALVFGGSSGASLALEAAYAGSAISKVVAYEPPYVTDGSRPALPSEEEITALVRAGRRGDAVELFMVKGADVPAEMLGQMRGQPFWADMEAIAHTLAYEAAIVGPGPVPAERFAALSVPVLVLAGAESPARMQDAARAVDAALPDSRLKVLDGMAHGQVDTKVLAAELAAFFTD
ncbi:alpha/beta hydrolase [Sphaerisporangium melleum]|uniref:Alpha/beta hydrolase n=2 Tax=Sphaerisporangium melleum TaxID=321316 RepID=A0A917VK19_9ACTN|nr:alpha/beta hydrolase [Sphaerisporangium melleum]GII73046.1 alpha/beta hydrolase [Sphaerisporangium melleum]